MSIKTTIFNLLYGMHTFHEALLLLLMLDATEVDASYNNNTTIVTTSCILNFNYYDDSSLFL